MTAPVRIQPPGIVWNPTLCEVELPLHAKLILAIVCAVALLAVACQAIVSRRSLAERCDWQQVVATAAHLETGRAIRLCWRSKHGTVLSEFVARWTQRLKIPEVVSLPVRIVPTRNVAEEPKSLHVVNVEFFAKFLFSHTAVTTHETIAGARLSALALPIRPIVVLSSAAPGPAILAGKVFGPPRSSAGERAIIPWRSPNRIRRPSQHGSAPSTGGLDPNATLPLSVRRLVSATTLEQVGARNAAHMALVPCEPGRSRPHRTTALRARKDLCLSSRRCHA